MSTHEKVSRKSCQGFHLTDKENQDWPACIPTQKFDASPSRPKAPDLRCPLAWRCSGSAGGPRGLPGMWASPGPLRETRVQAPTIGGGELKGAWGAVNSESLGTRRLGKVLPMGLQQACQAQRLTPAK